MSEQQIADQVAEQAERIQAMTLGDPLFAVYQATAITLFVLTCIILLASPFITTRVSNLWMAIAIILVAAWLLYLGLLYSLPVTVSWWLGDYLIFATWVWQAFLLFFTGALTLIVVWTKLFQLKVSSFTVKTLIAFILLAAGIGFMFFIVIYFALPTVIVGNTIQTPAVTGVREITIPTIGV